MFTFFQQSEKYTLINYQDSLKLPSTGDRQEMFANIKREPGTE